MFSPYYAKARRRSVHDPFQHCAVNAILYGRKNRWTMTERAAAAVERSQDFLRIGPSQLSLDGQTLVIQLQEITAPIPRRVQGEVRVSLPNMASHTFQLDKNAAHHWMPIAPYCKVSVRLNHPELNWFGTGYFDHNRGNEPLERGFDYWDWCRLNSPDGDIFLLYDRVLKNGQNQNLLLRYDQAGELVDQQRGQAQLDAIELTTNPMAKTRIWRMPRAVRCDPTTQPQIIRTLEDTPFYSRSEIRASLGGVRVSGVHESVSLRRFIHPIVQWMLPFRMPRRGGW